MSGYVVAAGARAAASLILLRDGDGGPEVLMLRRAERDNDMRSGAAVFPGGVLEAGDRAAHALCIGSDDAPMSARMKLREGGLDYAVAALRECFEEVGLLLVDRAVDNAAIEPWRLRLHAGEASIVDLCRSLDARLDLRDLHYYSHWLTPPAVPKRFDTRFFIARAPAGQVAVADDREALELMWLTPQAALEPARGLKLLPVTARTLQELSRFASVDAALAATAAREDIRITLPRVSRDRKGRRIVLPDELPYAEIGKLDPEGRGDITWCDLVPGRAVQLSAHVWRVTAPNPGVMTGPGTNSYFVGAGAQWTVIDPGPQDESHVQALLAAAPGPIERILVTHTHLDHSPAAAALSRATGAPVFGRIPLHAAGQDPGFAPVREPDDGERLAIAPGVTLRAIHTPGHASNHLCYLFEEEGMLFTGDHVMQGSTVVINPPDGDMAAYIAALGRLQSEAIDWLAPGHGYLVAEPQAVLAGLIAHRLKREAKVASALRDTSPATMERLLPRVYEDVPPKLHAVARRSLLAHLLKLQADGRADFDGEADTWAYVS